MYLGPNYAIIESSVHLLFAVTIIIMHMLDATKKKA